MEEKNYAEERISELEAQVKELKEKLENARFQDCGEPIKLYTLKYREAYACKDRNYSYEDLIVVTLPDGTTARVNAGNIYGVSEKKLYYAYPVSKVLYPIIIGGEKKYLLVDSDAREVRIVDTLKAYFTSAEAVKKHFMRTNECDRNEWSDELTEKYCEYFEEDNDDMYPGKYQYL